MARKYDRYGRNRQFRRNPTRSPKFFPYQLPFQNDFRPMADKGTEVSAATASRWRQVVRDITRGELFDKQTYKQAKRDREIIDEYVQNLEYVKKVQRRALGIASWGLSVPIKAEIAIARGTKNYDKLSRAYRHIANNYGQTGRFRTWH